MSWLDKYFRGSAATNIVEQADSRLYAVLRANLAGAIYTAGQKVWAPGRSANDDGGAGTFTCLEGTATDDGGTILTAGGLGVSSAGGLFLRRDFSAADGMNPAWFGAKLDGATNDTAAHQAAIDAANIRAIPLHVAWSGDTLVSTLTIAHPTHIRLGKGKITSNDATANLFEVGANLKIEGHNADDVELRPKTGGTAIKLTADWSPANYAAQRVLVSDVTIKGGDYGFDPSGAPAFSGQAHFERCQFYFIAQQAIKASGSAYWLHLDHSQFWYCEMAYESTLNVEIHAERCVFAMSATASCSVKLLGTYHEHFERCQFFGSVGNYNPDVILVPEIAAEGYEYLDHCEFGAEHEKSLDKRRRRILVKYATTPANYLTRLSLKSCEFLTGQLSLTSITRASGTATATLEHAAAAGHGLQVGDRIHVISVAAGAGTFNGEHVVTAVPTIDTVSWLSSGGDVGATAETGAFCASGELAAIGLENPVADLDVEGCLFEGYAYAVDDTVAIQSQDARGRSGGGNWKANKLHGPLTGLACQEFKSGNPGRWVDIFEAASSSPLESFDRTRRGGETPGLRQRLQYSEDLSAWTATGVTVTGSQADPLGGTSAFKLVRDGAAGIVTAGSPGGPWSIGEALDMQIDDTDLPAQMHFQVWARGDFPEAGDKTRTAWFMLIDAAGKTHWHAQATLPEDGSWKQYRFALGKNATFDTALLLLMSAGGLDTQAATVYLWHPAIDDHGGDYLPTTGAAYASSTAGTRFERDVQIGSGTTSITTGAYDPEGNETATVGSLFLRSDGTPGAYVKTSGSGNTGWTAL